MIDKENLYNALRQMGKKHLKPQYKDQWTPERPTTGYCYVVSEVLYHYKAPKGSKPWFIRISKNETHWCIKLPNNKIIDLTKDQFDKNEHIPYEKGKYKPFITKKISKRGKILADLLGFTKNK